MYFKEVLANMAPVTDVPRQWKSWRVLKSHYVKEKEQGRRTGKNGGNEGTCVPRASPRYNVWRIKVRLTGCLSSNYAPLQLVPACCRRRPRRGQIVHVVIMVYAPIVITIFKCATFNKITKTKWNLPNETYIIGKNSLAFVDFIPHFISSFLNVQQS